MGAGRPRAARRCIDGVLLLDKPEGLTSNAALQQAKRIFNAEKAGHTGTLDPLASGLLPICFGEATKFARFLLDADKAYRARVRFGVTTTTQDAEGDVMHTRAVTFERPQIEAALRGFTGAQNQIPPAHSALKYRGRSHYEYARAGIEVPRPARAIEVKALALLEWANPTATLDIVCSKGTYIRALAADLGDALGCGAHLAGLRRIAAGGFHIADAVSLDALAQCAPDDRDAHLRPADILLGALPRLDVGAAAAQRLSDGQSIATPAAAAGPCRVYDPHGRLVGVVQCRDGVCVPDRMARTPERGVAQ